MPARGSASVALATNGLTACRHRPLSPPWSLRSRLAQRDCMDAQGVALHCSRANGIDVGKSGTRAGDARSDGSRSQGDFPCLPSLHRAASGEPEVGRARNARRSAFRIAAAGTRTMCTSSPVAAFASSRDERIMARQRAGKASGRPVETCRVAAPAALPRPRLWRRPAIGTRRGRLCRRRGRGRSLCLPDRAQAGPARKRPIAASGARLIVLAASATDPFTISAVPPGLTLPQRNGPTAALREVPNGRSMSVAGNRLKKMKRSGARWRVPGRAVSWSAWRRRPGCRAGW